MTAAEPETGVFKEGGWFKPGDVDAFRNALDKLLNNPDERAALGHAARRAIRQGWSAEEMVDMVLDLYNKVR